jgi:hypothetical protein
VRSPQRSEPPLSTMIAIGLPPQIGNKHRRLWQQAV